MRVLLREQSLIAGLALLVMGAGCDPTSRKLSGTDCKPRKLAKMQTCIGEDHGFQECGFYFRATGVPDKSWCEALAATASVSGPIQRCDWSKAAAWQRVPCALSNIHGAAACFTCDGYEPESSKTYVYAYDAACTRGVEQVTCNVESPGAGDKLGPFVF